MGTREFWVGTGVGLVVGVVLSVLTLLVLIVWLGWHDRRHSRPEDLY